MLVLRIVSILSGERVRVTYRGISLRLNVKTNFSDFESNYSRCK